MKIIIAYGSAQVTRDVSRREFEHYGCTPEDRYVTFSAYARNHPKDARKIAQFFTSIHPDFPEAQRATNAFVKSLKKDMMRQLHRKYGDIIYKEN